MINLELTLFTLRYYYTTTILLDVISAIWSKTKLQVKKQGKMDRNKSPFSKTKTWYLLLCQHQETTVTATAARWREEGRDFAKISNPRIWSNDKKKSLQQKYQSCQVLQAPWSGQAVLQARRPGPSVLWGHRNLLAKMIVPKKKIVEKARKDEPVIFSESASKNTKYMPRKCV